MLKAVGFMMAEMGLSERRSCRIVGLARSVQQYHPVPRDGAELVARLRIMASENSRYGCPQLHAKLQREDLNHKRTWRLYRAEGLQVGTKKRRKLPRRDRVAPQVPERPMQREALDFITDQFADSRPFRIINIVDHHSRFCPGQLVDLSISGARLARHLDEIAELHSCPRRSSSTTAPKAPAEQCSTGRSEQASGWFIEPGKPVQNAFVGSFNGKLGDECLNLHWFRSLRHAGDEIAAWRRHHNTEPPHSALASRSPEEYGARCRLLLRDKCLFIDNADAPHQRCGATEEPDYLFGKLQPAFIEDLSPIELS